MAEDRQVLREIIAEVLARKWAQDNGTRPLGRDVEMWRPYADAVMGLFDVGRESFDGVTSRVVLTLAPFVPAATDHSAKPSAPPDAVLDISGYECVHSPTCQLRMPTPPGWPLGPFTCNCHDHAPRRAE